MKETFEFDFSELKLDIHQIEKVMGSDGNDSLAIVSGLIVSMLAEASEFCRPRAEYALYTGANFNEAEKKVTVGGIEFNPRRIVYSQIKKADSIAVFLCTAGEEIGIRSRKAMKEGDLLTGYVYDVIGSEITEAAGDLMQERLGLSVALQGKKTTNRYSPGYCGWDVAEQHKLFSLVPENYCGIRLTPSALMDPIKSISGFIGVGNGVKNSSYLCKTCNMRDCIYRRKKT